MRGRSIFPLALTLALAVACDQPGIELEERLEGTVSVTIGLSASEIGAATVEFFVSHPTALPQPFQAPSRSLTR